MNSEIIGISDIYYNNEPDGYSIGFIIFRKGDDNLKSAISY